MLFKSLIISLASASLATSQEQSEPTCTSYSQPNPIWTKFPGNVTGTVNATIAIIPIPYALARSIIPKEYGILKEAYRSILPSLADDMYPALLQTVRDHDVRYGEYQIPDFSRASIEFPFVNLLQDGHTSFRYSPAMLLTSTSEMAIHGAQEYGTTVYPSSFEPECNAYEHVRNEPLATYLKAKSVSGGKAASIDTVFRPSAPGLSTSRDFPMEFFVNTTNQPSFKDGKMCDEYIRFFNTSLSTGANAPVPVSGTVKTKLELFEGEMVWEDVVGVKVDTAFIENHLVSCQALEGYTGVEDQKIKLAWSTAPEMTNSSFMPAFSLQAVLSNYLISPLKRVVT